MRLAIRPTTSPTPKPNPRFSQTNCQTTKWPLGASAAASASTAGSARPSLSPDSRFSEPRTIAGTRGLVTTFEDRTGSVGDSSAPTRNASVHVSPISSLVASATTTAVSGIAAISLRAGRCQLERTMSPSTSRPSRSRITISATVARSATNAESRVKSSTPMPPLPSMNPATTNTPASDTKLRLTSSESSAPAISSPPSTTAATSNECDTSA